MFTRMTALVVLAILLLQGTDVLAAPSNQTVVDTQKWAMYGKVLDTTGLLNYGVAEAFTAAASESEYPLYMLILSEELYEANPDAQTQDVAMKILNGDYGAEFQWLQKGVNKGFFADDMILLVLAPFVSRPNIDPIPENHPWKRAITYVYSTNRFDVIWQLKKDNENTYAVDIAYKAERSFDDGDFSPLDAQNAANYMAQTALSLGLYPDGVTPPSLTTTSAPRPTSTSVSVITGAPELGSGRSLGSWFLWFVVILIGSGVTLYVVVLWIPARWRAQNAWQKAAHLATSYQQEANEVRITIAAQSEVADPAEIRALRERVDQAVKKADKGLANYDDLKDHIGSVPWIQLHIVFDEITNAVKTEVLQFLEKAKAEFKAIETDAQAIPLRAAETTDLLAIVNTTIGQAEFAVQQLEEDGYASTFLANGVANLRVQHESAGDQVEARRYTVALELLEHLSELANQVQSDIINWRTRVSGFAGELAGLDIQLQFANDGVDDLQDAVKRMRQKYDDRCWEQVEENPAAIKRLLEQLQLRLVAAQTALPKKDFDAVASAIQEIEAGLDKADVLAKSITELETDLTELSEELPTDLSEEQEKLTAALAYARDNEWGVDAETVLELERADTLLDSAAAALKEPQPNLLQVQKLLQEASEVRAREDKEAHDEVKLMTDAQKRAQNFLKSSANAQSRLHNFVEDHGEDLQPSTKRSATEAAKMHTKAAAAFEAAETMPGGQEEERLEQYKEASELAKQAQEKAEMALEKAQDDIEPDVVWTPSLSSSYSGGSYSGGSTYTPPTYTVPNYRPSVVVHRPAPAPTPARSTIGGGGVSRSYSTPVRISSPARSSIGGGGVKR